MSRINAVLLTSAALTLPLAGPASAAVECKPMQKAVDCAVIAGFQAFVQCSLSAEQACAIKKHQADWADCYVAETQVCEAQAWVGGVVFCDGQFIGPDECLGVDVDNDLCVDADVQEGAACEVKYADDCARSCDAAAVDGACLKRLGADADTQALVTCEDALVARCLTICGEDRGGAFCDAQFVGADMCIKQFD